MVWRIKIKSISKEESRRVTYPDLSAVEITDGGRLEQFRIVTFNFLEVNNPKVKVNIDYSVMLLATEYTKIALRAKIKDIITATPEEDPWIGTEETIL